MLISCLHRGWPAMVAGVMLFGGSSAVAQPVRVAVTDPRQVMLAALRSADGTASGDIKGDLYQAMAGPLGLSTPLWLDVRTLVRYRQPGCARLLLHFHQEGVPASVGQPAGPRTMDVTMNYCRDGKPPAYAIPAEGP